MKIKLSFLLLIVLLSACSQKSQSGNAANYYTQEIKKQKRLDSIDKLNIKTRASLGTASYLTAAERIKFSKILKIKENKLKNEKLYDVINDWLNTPYQWGGTTKKGVDCSAYVQDVYKKVFGFELPRTSNEQFNYNIKANFKGQQHLQEGDLVFFRLRHNDKIVSHVGIYLQNGKFTGSNSPRGVEIADLNTDYWQDRFVSGARLLKKKKL